MMCRPSPVAVAFQSTPPARGATIAHSLILPSLSDFNPRPPRGGRPVDGGVQVVLESISIHAPREGGDLFCVGSTMPPYLFQSTPPARGATRMHASSPCSRSYFNPRPPRGGRRWMRFILWECLIFQSTPPARGATSWASDPASSPRYFNPRPPRGGRRIA